MIFPIKTKFKKTFLPFEHDMIVFCRFLMQEISNTPIPKHLQPYFKTLFHTSIMNSDFPKECTTKNRVYIMGYRLNPIFASFDTNNSISQAIDTLDSQIDHYRFQPGECEYNFGLIPPVHDFPIFQYKNLKNDSKIRLLLSEKYGFLPIELLSHPCILYFSNTEMEKPYLISDFELALFIHKFSGRNCIDLSALANKLF